MSQVTLHGGCNSGFKGSFGCCFSGIWWRDGEEKWSVVDGFWGILVVVPVRMKGEGEERGCQFQEEKRWDFPTRRKGRRGSQRWCECGKVVATGRFWMEKKWGSLVVVLGKGWKMVK